MAIMWDCRSRFLPVCWQRRAFLWMSKAFTGMQAFHLITGVCRDPRISRITQIFFSIRGLVQFVDVRQWSRLHSQVVLLKGVPAKRWDFAFLVFGIVFVAFVDGLFWIFFD